jgi:hypothetical protein
MDLMRKATAYLLGLIGFLIQGTAMIGLPTYVIFLDGSAWRMLLFFPLGFVGMIPLGIMHAMLKEGGSL